MANRNENTDPAPQPTPLVGPPAQPTPQGAKEGELASGVLGPENEARKDLPSEAVVAATDECFRQQAVLPLEPNVAQDAPPPASLADEVRLQSTPDPTAHPSARPDYLRELQQEFEEQEEEGKV